MKYELDTAWGCCFLINTSDRTDNEQTQQNQAEAKTVRVQVCDRDK